MMDNDMNNLMIDIETLGDREFPVIISIAAVPFKLNGSYEWHRQNSFYKKIDLQSSFDAGMSVSKSTLVWWLNQPEEYREEWKDGKGDKLEDVLSDFKQYLGEIRRDIMKEPILWAKSPLFDLAHIRSAFHRVLDEPEPWGRRNTRDVRTIENLSDHSKEIKEQTMKESELNHHPVDDAIQQIKIVGSIFTTLGE